ncbi:MAG: hypothetical protein ACOYVF_07325 [Candidatus Zixiibacteriota bacterium]
MLTIRICVAVLILLWLGAITGASDASELKIKAGAGYDFISQEYYLDSLIVDTLEAQLATSKTFLDDFKTKLNIYYAPGKLRNWELRTGLEQTSEFFRFKLSSDNILRWGNNTFEWNNDIDWRSRYRGDDDPGDSYIYGQTRARLKRKLSESLTIRGQADFDAVRFDSISDYNYNYYRVGGKVGISKTFPDFSFLDINLFLLNRQVVDSTDLNYLSTGFDGSYFNFMELNELDFYLRLEHKDYKKTDNSDDYYRLELDGRHKYRFSESCYLREELDFELAIFNEDDLINENYTRTGVTFQGGIQKGDIDLRFGPDFEYLAQQNTYDYDNSESYFEFGVKADFDYIKIGRFFGSLESIFGYRNLKYESELQSNFSFERLSVIADWNLVGGLSFNIMFSAEWEWHDNRDENSQIFLLNSGLYYNF